MNIAPHEYKPMPPRSMVVEWVDGADIDELRLLQQVIHSRLQLADAKKAYAQSTTEFGA